MAAKKKKAAKKKTTKKKISSKKPRKKTAGKKRVEKQKPVVAAEDKSLTAKQKVFGDEYLIDLNATQAAIRAGYSEKTAAEMGYENLSKPHIVKYVQLAMENRSERTKVTQDMVIQELARIAFLDIRQAFNEHGELLKIPDMPEDVARAIGGMDVSRYTEKGEDGGTETTETTKKIKIIDKKGALELLGRNLKMFTDKRELTGPGGGPVQVISADMSPEEATALYKSILHD